MSPRQSQPTPTGRSRRRPSKAAEEAAGAKTAPRTVRQTLPRAAETAPSGSAVDLADFPLERINLAGLDPAARISPNFRVYELTRSELAARRGIDNDFASDEHLRAAVHLAREVLQPIREQFGSFTPNSVYRSQKLEQALKNKPPSWISTSQHARGEACDIEIVGMPTLDLARWAEKHLDTFDQIICECYDPRKGPNSGWVHISLKPPGSGPNRKETLSYVLDPAGRLVYVKGLKASG